MNRWGRREQTDNAWMRIRYMTEWGSGKEGDEKDERNRGTGKSEIKEINMGDRRWEGELNNLKWEEEGERRMVWSGQQVAVSDSSVEVLNVTGYRCLSILRSFPVWWMVSSMIIQLKVKPRPSCEILPDLPEMRDDSYDWRSVFKYIQNAVRTSQRFECT